MAQEQHRLPPAQPLNKDLDMEANSSSAAQNRRQQQASCGLLNETLVQTEIERTKRSSVCEKINSGTEHWETGADLTGGKKTEEFDE
jgi:hypothetical protein